jgi:hypothetical protein
MDVVLVKYGVTLNSDNLAGTSLEVEAFSDQLGGTTTKTVADGDIVVDVTLNEDSNPTGTIWTVVDGAPWVESPLNDYKNWVSNLANTAEAIGEAAPDLSKVSMLFIVSVCPDLQYQNGTIVMFMPDSSIITLNLGLTQALIDSAISAL